MLLAHFKARLAACVLLLGPSSFADALVNWPATTVTGSTYTCDTTAGLSLSANVTWTNSVFKNCGPLTIPANVVLTLNNVTVDGSGYKNGTDALVRVLGKIVASSSTFRYIVTNTSNTYYGGAISVSSGTFQGTSTTFTGNQAPKGGAVGVKSGGNLTCSKCSFTNNGKNDSVSDVGGALYFDSYSTFSLSDSTFSNNTVGQTYTSDGGGAIYMQSATGTGSNLTFYNNFAYEGGAIQLMSTPTTFNCTNCYFIGDGQLWHAQAHGGAVHVSSGPTFTWNGGSCIGLSAGTRGSCLFVDSNISANSSVSLYNVFMGNGSAPAGLMEQSYTGSSLYAYNLTAENFTATGAGFPQGITPGNGAVINGDGTTLIVNSNFMNLTAKYGGFASMGTSGASNVISNASLNVTNCTLESISALSGGFVYSRQYAVVNVAQTTMRYLSSTAGGALAYMDAGAIINWGDSSFSRGSISVGNPGGLVKMTNVGVPVALQSTFRCFGVSTLDGSGIVATNGGCIRNTDSYVDISGSCAVTNCTASALGGIIYLSGVATTTVRGNATLMFGNATSGGCLYNNNGNITISDSAVVGNCSASGNGGVLYNLNAANLTMSGSSALIYGSGQNGGCVYNVS
ncbi:hypothetical protein HDU87_003981 [Geranomyces variabilis]|uniref:Uncharacterized protein n=1 Tax=Geranomyces variabilis TaxID=109894 RepID=A0AAD5TTU3_9FUNG|nr:hypothetical protein HDU87_003981 [Geranomyces variabilis]